MSAPFFSRASLPILLMSLALSGCLAVDHALVPESFSSEDTFSRSYPLSPAQACEAGRRALLSQGYGIDNATADSVQGSKNFQPSGEVHEQLLMRVSCVAHEQQGSWVFVSALQERYALKKSPTSASVGLGGIGSVSLPIAASDDSLVRVASVTVQDAAFYNAFFDRLGQHLPPPKARPVVGAKPTPDRATPASEAGPAIPPSTSPPVAASPDLGDSGAP